MGSLPPATSCPLPPSSYNPHGAPFTLCIISGSTSSLERYRSESFHPLSCPLLIGRKPKVVPLQTTTIHIPPTYDGVSRKHLQIIRVCANKVKVKLCEKAINSCLIIRGGGRESREEDGRKEKVTVDKKESVDFNLGDTLILDRYNGKNASLVCHLLKNDDIYPKSNSNSNGSSSNVSIISNGNGHGNKDEGEMVEMAQNPKEVIKSKEDLEKEYNSLPSRGDRVKIKYTASCNYLIEKVQTNYFFGTVKSKRKSGSKLNVASYKIGFDDGTEDCFEHPATEVEMVEEGDLSKPNFSSGENEIGKLCEGQYQDEKNWYRGRIAGVEEGKSRVDIVYIDGDGEKNVPLSNVRLVKEEVEWVEKDPKGKFLIDGKEVTREEKVKHLIAQARDECEKEGRFNFFPSAIVQSPSKKRVTRKKRKPKKPTMKEIQDGQARTKVEEVMDDGHIFPMGSLESKVRDYRLRLARSSALKKLEYDNAKLLTQGSVASTVVMSSQATLSSGGDGGHDVSFKATEDMEGEGREGEGVLEAKDRPVVREMPLSLFQPLLQGVQGSDPLEAYNYLAMATSVMAPPFVSRSINVFEIIKGCKDVRRVTFLCNYVERAEKKYPSFRVTNTGGSVFSWDDFLGGICRPKEAVGEEELECAAVVVGCLGRFIEADFEGGGLDRDKARGRPISVFWRRGLRESLKQILKIVVESYLMLSPGAFVGYADVEFEAEESMMWLARILCLVFKIYEESGEDDGPFIVKDEIVKMGRAKERTELCKLLDEDVRKKVVKKLGKSVGKI
ncbi:hypothetical protein TrLO_g11632 [Triparma laevis f. longispina]|uniref:Tudor domain-containing protein n=1 Tax=Triparma laevis f. longispina TaxID=1714387 RepID=A0A9W7F6U8_9STRA|nr:hypothetical protein TrLO_g11632 [Triparma laevis f. longispina]